MDEEKFQVGDQWFYRGNRANTWYATYREGGGLADRIPSVCCQDIQSHQRHKEALAKLLRVPKKDDYYDFSKYRSPK